MPTQPHKIKDLGALKQAADERRSLRCANYRPFPWQGQRFRPIPASWIYNMPASSVHSLIINGLFIYTPKR